MKISQRRSEYSIFFLGVLFIATAVQPATALESPFNSYFYGTRFGAPLFTFDIGDKGVSGANALGRLLVAFSASWAVEKQVGGAWSLLNAKGPSILTTIDDGDVHVVESETLLEDGAVLRVRYTAKGVDVSSAVPKIAATLIPDGGGIYQIWWRITGPQATRAVLLKKSESFLVGVSTGIGRNETELPVSGTIGLSLRNDQGEVLLGIDWQDASHLADKARISSNALGAATVRIGFGTYFVGRGESLTIDPCVLGTDPEAGNFCGGGGGGGGPPPTGPTRVQGYVRISGTVKGIYGAKVSVGGAISYTGSDGFYSITLGTGGTYTATASAGGYYSVSNSITVSTGTTLSQDFALSLWNTYEKPVWYNLRNDYNSVAGNAHVAYSLSTDSHSISVVTISSGELGAPTSTPSGDTKMIRMYGRDNSPVITGYAYTYFYLTDVYIPLSSPMFLAFNIYVYRTPKYPGGNPGGKVSVDAHFTDGSVLRDLVDDTGSYIQDGFRNRIHPALERLERCHVALVTGNVCRLGWTRVVADLTEVRGKTIDYLMVAYDNGQTGGGGEPSENWDIFQVYFDDIRFEMPVYPVNTINSGFEQQGKMYGWGIAGNKRPQIVWGGNSPIPHDGQQAAYLGRNPSFESASSVVEDSYLSQVFRIPNDGSLLNPALQFWAYLGTQESCACTSNDWVKVYFRDRTTGQDITLLLTATNTGAWTKYSYDAGSLKGHIVWLIIQVHQDTNSLATWAYFDEVRIVPQGATVFDMDRYDSKIILDPTIYTPSSLTARVLSQSFAGATTFPSVDGGIALAIDLYSFVHDPGFGRDTPRFSVSTIAWVNGAGYYIRDVSLKVSVYVLAGTSTVGVGFLGTYGHNLGPFSGFVQVDPIVFVMTALGIDLTVISAATLILGGVPGVDIPIFIVTTAMLVIGAVQLIFRSSTPVTSTANSVSTTWNYQNSLPEGVEQGGGMAFTEPWFGIGGGLYKILIEASAGVYQDQCTQNSCWPSKVTDLTTLYQLFVQTN